MHGHKCTMYKLCPSSKRVQLFRLRKFCLLLHRKFYSFFRSRSASNRGVNQGRGSLRRKERGGKFAPVIPIFGDEGESFLSPLSFFPFPPPDLRCHYLCSAPARAAPSRPTRPCAARAAARITARGRARWRTGPRAGTRSTARESRGRAAIRTLRRSRARSLASRT